ncbi:MAG TPA: hypothetical protein VEZ13_12085 [Brevibacillus sp.]|nr:hypothetical protein [Brevibacillus sp.]
MSYNPKLDWQPDDDITEDDVNRWEKGIADAMDIALSAETPEGAQAKVDALAGIGNTKTVKQLDDEIQGVAANQGAITDTVTGKKYKFGMENGLVFLEVVGG